jgi:hypothetical protein
MWESFVQVAPIYFLLAVGAMFSVLAYIRERQLNKVLKGTRVDIRLWVLSGEKTKFVYPEFLWWLQLIRRGLWVGLWALASLVIWTTDLSFSSAKTWEFIVFVWIICIVLQIERRNRPRVERMEAVPELAGQLGMLRKFKIYGGFLFLLLVAYAGWLIVSEKTRGDEVMRRIYESSGKREGA